VSPDEPLQGRIDYEFSQIEREIGIIDRLAFIFQKTDLDDIQIRAAASSLHSVYNGLEKIIVLLLKAKGASIAEGSFSHSESLQLARSKLIISEELESDLRDFMAFRHFYRHNYGFILDGEMMKPLLMKARSIVQRMRNEIRF
jgi:hypothetical protein